MSWIASAVAAAFKCTRITFLVSGVSMLAFVPGSASAAEFRPSTPTQVKVEFGDEIEYIDVSGQIEPGDAQKFAALLSDLGVDRYEFRVTNGLLLKLRLNSPGGSLSEAIEIARLIDTHKIQTFIAQGAECLSACAVIFMAGTIRGNLRASDERWRKVEWPAKLGFHRPFLIEESLDIPPGKALAQLGADELAKELNLIAEDFNKQFLAAFDAANELIQEMLRVDPNAWNPELLVRMLTATEKSEDGQFVYLETVGDALTWGIDIENVKPLTSKTREEKATENFWLCYNAGRALPVYKELWPEISERRNEDEGSAEEMLEEYLSLVDSTPGGGGWASDDELHYHAQLRWWTGDGCTIRYEEVGGDPEITLLPYEAMVRKTHPLQRYNPSWKLDRVVGLPSISFDFDLPPKGTGDWLVVLATFPGLAGEAHQWVSLLAAAGVEASVRDTGGPDSSYPMLQDLNAVQLGPFDKAVASQVLKTVKEIAPDAFITNGRRVVRETAAVSPPAPQANATPVTPAVSASASPPQMAPAASGRCYVYRGKDIVDDEPCRLSTRNDPAVGAIEVYIWPSGGKTVVVRDDGHVSVNGADTVVDKADRGDVDFCYLNKESGNTFCFKNS